MEDLRRTHRYEFKKPDLESLRKLARRLRDPDHFRGRYGNLMDILMEKVDEGLLNTLVQFFDPVHHGFTFPDFQLFPTLEEYSHWVGLPVLNQVPFQNLELTPKQIQALAKTLHHEITDLRKKFVPKAGLQCLSYNFLYQKATDCLDGLKIDIDAFESTLALLIYGIVLFPNVNGFVDMNAIQVFLTQNPVPVLLADTYVSIRERTDKGKGTFLCCAPLLHLWITSHLPRPKFRPERLPWSQKLMTLTPNDVVWFNPVCDPEFIINSCGVFNNVPLLGTRGGICYSPVLARRQFGYPMEMKPVYRILDKEFFLYKEDKKNLGVQFEKAWHSIIRLDRNQLGRKSSITHEDYVQWVINRAKELKMPYPRQRYVSATTPAIPMPLPPESLEGYQKQLDFERREKAAVEGKLRKKGQDYEIVLDILEKENWANHQLKVENAELKRIIKEKNAILERVSGSKKRRMDMFAGAHPDFPE
jgi:hypothetical protein